MTDEAPHILVVDDDNRLRSLLRRFLSENGFRVSVAGDAAEARRTLASLDFDLLVLDVMMPGENGFALVRSLRETRSVPILMLSALGETDNRIEGLERGADDYLAKPFEPRELVLRLRALLRRARAEPPPAPVPAAPQPIAVRLGELRFDAGRMLLLRGEQAVRLTTAEATLLGLLAERPGEVMSRETLTERVGIAGGTRAVDVQVTRLRRKIEPDPKFPRYLQTVRGRGYVLRPD
ncbi:MAG: response regulator transcription factor [Alphaproteobacteria bacterium]|nr:response regulator transcription factor [Alphaproteobacteria bacterium]